MRKSPAVAKVEQVNPAVVSRIEQWPLDRLIPYARNARTHSDDQVAQIAASIKEFGFVNPILVGPDCVIIAGHARLMAARKLGLTEAPVIVVDGLTESQRRALSRADNRLPLEAGWDEAMLRLEIEALRDADYDIDLLGFEDEGLANLLAQRDAAPGLTDEDAVPETPANPIAAPGDLWLLGDHRLICGDCNAAWCRREVAQWSRADPAGHRSSVRNRVGHRMA